MRLFKIALKNVIDSLSMYRLYLLSMVFSVILFYQFINLSNHPTLRLINGLDIVSGLSNVTIFVMMIFVIFFLNFSNSFYIKERKKEIGLYSLIGTTPGKIGLIIAIENLLMFLLATVLGIFFGVLLSKLFLMVIAYGLNLGITIEFYLDINAIIWSASVFMIIGVLLSIKSYITIWRSNITHLLKGSKKEEREPKGRLLIGLISLVVIYIGYWFSWTIEPSTIIQNFFGAVIFVILGTFLFYRSVMTMILKQFMNHKNFVYKKNRLVMYSNLWHRIGTNYRVYAAVTVYLACTLTAFATSYSFYYGVEDMASINYPVDIEVNGTKDIHNEMVAEIDGIIESADTPIISKSEAIEFISVHVTLLGDESSLFSGEVSSVMNVMSYKEASRHLEKMEFKHKEVLFNQSLEAEEAIYVYPAGVFMSLELYSDATILGEQQGPTVSIKDLINIPVFGELSPNTLIISDSLYERLVSEYDVIEYFYTGYIMKEDDFVDSNQEVLTLSTPTNEFSEDHHGMTTAYPNAMTMSTDIMLIKLFFILGVFLALSFILATGSIIYFKVVSQAREDIVTFKLLRNLGLENKQMSRIIYKQTLMFFLIPLLFATVHSYFAIKALEIFMGLILITPMIVSFGVIGLIFYIYFMITMLKYRQIVLR